MNSISQAKKGYYTVHIESQGIKIPYIVLASSDYHAARLVRDETGFFAPACDVIGPLARV
jgi:hypothetical protein